MGQATMCEERRTSWNRSEAQRRWRGDVVGHLLKPKLQPWLGSGFGTALAPLWLWLGWALLITALGFRQVRQVVLALAWEGLRLAPISLP